MTPILILTFLSSFVFSKGLKRKLEKYDNLQILIVADGIRCYQYPVDNEQDLEIDCPGEDYCGGWFTLDNWGYLQSMKCSLYF